MASQKVIRTGSRALLVYPAGDCDWVRVQSINHDHAIVKLPGGKLAAVVVEDIGIGVDDDIVAVFEDGCVGVVHGDHQLVWELLPDRGLFSREYVARLPRPVKASYSDKPATHVGRWYNRTTRDWVVFLADEKCEQLGPSEYVYSLEDALIAAEHLARQAGER